MKIICVFMVCFLILLHTSLAKAHHGFSAHYDRAKVVRIEGTIKQFKFMNPHSLLYIDTLNEEGETITYLCDLQAKTQMLRHGIDEARFAVGDRIVVDGFQARRDPLQCEYAIGYFTDGTSFKLRDLGSARSEFFDNTAPVTDNKSVIGNWMRVGMFGEKGGIGPSSGMDSITEAGKTAQDNYDMVLDNPMIHCRGASPIRNWRAPGLATSIYEQDKNIYIYHESMDITRIIHLNNDVVQQDVEPNDMGFSVGRFDGNDLIIETNNFTDGILIPGVITLGEDTRPVSVNSDQMTIQETLTVLDSGYLKISWVVNEPIYYSELITGSQVLRPTDKEILSYDCVPEADY